jgi:hypothetical protein
VRILGILGGDWRIRAYWYVDGLALIDTEFTDVIFCLLYSEVIIESSGKVHSRTGQEGPEVE